MANRLDAELLITAGVKGLPHVDRLIEKIAAAGGDTEQLKEAAQALSDEWDNLSTDEQAKRLHSLANAANNSAKDVGLLGKSTEKTTGMFGRMQAAVFALGSALGVVFVFGKIKSFFSNAISGAADFEQQLATVQAVSGSTATEMAKIKAASEELGKSTRFNATQAAEGFEILARSGLTAAEQLETIPSVLALAQGNALSLSEAADFVTKATQGMGLEFSEAGRVADVLAKAASSASTTVQGIGAAMSYAAPSAASLGLTVEETASYIALFANAGIDASRAGTSFNAMLSQFSNSASSFRRELANIGITTNDFNQAIAQLAAAGTDGQTAINALGTEAGPALKALLLKGMDALDEITHKVNNASGAAQEQADTMNNTWQGALAGLQSAWQSLKDKLGESFLQPMTQGFKDLSTTIVGLVDSGKITELGQRLAQIFSEGTKAVVAFIQKLDISAVLAAVSKRLDNLRLVGRALNGAFQALSITLNVLKSGLLGIGGVLATVAEGWLRIFKVLVDGGRVLGKTFGITSKTLDSFSQSLQKGIEGAVNFRKMAAEEIDTAANSIGDSFKSIAGVADDSAAQSSEAINEIPKSYATAAEQAAAESENAFNKLVAAAKSSSTETAQQFDIIRSGVQQMMQGFDNPEQFAALINHITKAGQESAVGADLLEKMGLAAAKGSETAQQAAQKASDAVKKLGDDAAQQAEATKQAIATTFNALNLDVSQSLNGVNSKTQQVFDLMSNGAKEVATSSYNATEKAKLLAALFSKGLNAAKTKEEFQALSEAARKYGLGAAATTEQSKMLQAGMKGGAEAAKKAKAEYDKQAKSLTENTEAAKQNTESSKQNADAKKQQADANAKASQAVANNTEQMQKSTQTTVDMSNSIVGYAHQQVHGLQQIGLTAEQTDAIMSTLFDSIVGMRYPNYEQYANAITSLTKNATDQAKVFARLKNEAASMTQTLGGATVSSNDLSHAQGLLKRATTATVNGMIRMDSQTLDNLKSAIDAARQRMQGLASDAKNTADNLQATLARLKGDDTAARQIEQQKKLSDITQKLQEARRRGNSAEITQLERALSLQKQINHEETRQAKTQKRQQIQPQPTETRQQTSSTSNTNNALNATDLAKAWDERIKQAEERGAQRFAQQLRDEAKRMAR